jgi:hypothetical protein
MSHDIMSLYNYFPQHNYAFFGNAPVVFHCHHFNLFLDQSIDDALGRENGQRVRTKAAHDAAYHLIHGLARGLGLQSPNDVFQVASTVFSAMGHGTLPIQGDQTGGSAQTSHLHYGYSWFQKYGQQVGRRHPADAFAAGYGAAAIEVAYNLPKGTIWGRETQCVSMGASNCHINFSLQPHNDRNWTPFEKDKCLSMVPKALEGQFEAQITAITNGLVEFLGTLGSDQRGLLEGFGVFVTMHLAEYYNRISFEALQIMQQTKAFAVPLIESLLRESGHVCVFNTFGGILRSPEWEGMVGPPGRTKEDTILSCTAIARSLGFGHWIVKEFIPETRLVLQTIGNYEAPFYLHHFGKSDTGRCYFFQGAALAFMQLAHRVDWKAKPEFSQDFYNQLFRGGVPWEARETMCRTMGHEYCEVVVEKK